MDLRIMRKQKEDAELQSGKTIFQNIENNDRVKITEEWRFINRLQIVKKKGTS